jgi:hypothetical protein
MTQQTDSMPGGPEDIDPTRPVTPGQVAEDLNEDLAEPAADHGGRSDDADDEDTPTAGI